MAKCDTVRQFSSNERTRIVGEIRLIHLAFSLWPTLQVKTVLGAYAAILTIAYYKDMIYFLNTENKSNYFFKSTALSLVQSEKFVC